MAVIYLGTVAFPVSPNPSSGDFYFGFNTANSNRITKQDSSGTLTDIESGATYTDSDAVNAVYTAVASGTVVDDVAYGDRFLMRDVSDNSNKVATKSGLQSINPNLFYTNASDFIGTITGDLVATNSGTGASSQSGVYGEDNTENAMGVTQLDTGTTSTGRAGLGAISTTAFATGATRLKFCARTAIEALSTPTETFFYFVGFGQFYTQANEGTNGLYFRYTDLQNGGRYEAVSRGGGADLVAIDTGISPDVDYHNFEIQVDEDGQEVRYYIDGSQVAIITNPALIPTAIQRFGFGVQIRKSVGTSQRNMDIDLYVIETERSTTR